MCKDPDSLQFQQSTLPTYLRFFCLCVVNFVQEHTYTLILNLSRLYSSSNSPVQLREVSENSTPVQTERE